MHAVGCCCALQVAALLCQISRAASCHGHVVACSARAFAFIRTHDRPGTAALPSEVTDQELAEVFGPSPVAKAGAADDEDSSFGYNPFDHLDDEAGSDPSSEAIEAAEAAAAEETGDAETEEATSAAPAMTVVPGNRQKKAAKATGPKKRSLRQPDDVPLQLRAKR